MEKELMAEFKNQLPEIKAALASGVSYASELGEKIIMYDIVATSLWLGVYLAVFVFLVLNCKKFNIKIIEIVGDNPYGTCEVLYVWNLSLLWFGVGIAVYINNLILDIFLPEIRLVELLMNFIN